MTNAAYRFALAPFLSGLVLVGCVWESDAPDNVATASFALGQLTNQIGRLTTSGNSRRRATFNYDPLGRAKETQHAMEGTAYLYTDRHGYPRRPLGAGAAEVGTVLQSTQLPDGEVVSYEYDSGGEQQKVTAGVDVIVAAIRRNARGQIISVVHGNDVETEHRYDEQGDLRLSQIVSTHRPPGAPARVLQAYDYTFDGAGNTQEIRDYCDPDTDECPCDPTAGASCLPRRLSRAFEYDEMDRLTRVAAPAGMTIPGLPRSYGYDAIDNLTRKDGVNQTYGASGKPHALASAGGTTYGYDRNGNLVSTSAGLTIAWNVQNMPALTIANGARVRKEFMGEAVWKKVEAGATTLYLPSIRIENGRMRKYYGSFAERDPDAGGELRFYHGDHLGSSTLVTDAEGSVVHRAAYLAYGEEDPSYSRDNSFDPTYRFNFEEREETTGLYDYGARMYDPVTGRWISPDSSSADGLNRYAYARNNPLRYVDPTGHDTSDPLDGFYIARHEEGLWRFQWFQPTDDDLVIKENGELGVRVPEGYTRIDPGFVFEAPTGRMYRLGANDQIQAMIGGQWSLPFNRFTGPSIGSSLVLGFLSGMTFGLDNYLLSDMDKFLNEWSQQTNPMSHGAGGIAGGLATGGLASGLGRASMAAGPEPYLWGLRYGRSGVGEVALGARPVLYGNGYEAAIDVPWWSEVRQMHAIDTFQFEAARLGQSVRVFPGGMWTHNEFEFMIMRGWRPTANNTVLLPPR